MRIAPICYPPNITWKRISLPIRTVLEDFQRSEIREWCKNNGTNSKVAPFVGFYAFESDKDAVLFALKWTE